MHFDDSFFEDSDGCKKKRADKQKVAYTAKRCEPEVHRTVHFVDVCSLVTSSMMDVSVLSVFWIQTSVVCDWRCWWSP